MKHELAPQGTMLLSPMPRIPDEIVTWLTGKDRPEPHLKGRLEGRDGEGVMCYIYHVGVLATEMKNWGLPEAVSRWLANQRRESEPDKLIFIGPFPRITNPQT